MGVSAPSLNAFELPTEAGKVVGEAREVMRALWANPERPLEEIRSSCLLGEWLREYDFDIEYRAGGVPTAFRAGWGSGTPVIGFLAEYDALPALSNDRVAFRRRLAEHAGHACGHCLLGPANVFAAILARNWLERTGGTGRIEVIGSPAEEILWGKVALLDRGGFEGVDVLLTSHADYFNAVANRPCQASRHGEWVFEGCAGHAGRDGAADALSAAEAMIHAVAGDADGAFKRVRVSHTIRSAGVAPNIVPDRASVWWWFRGDCLEDVDRAYFKASEIGRAAASGSGVRVRAHLVSACRGYLPNSAVADVLWSEYRKAGPPRWVESDLSWMRELSATASPAEKFSLDREVHYLDEGMDCYAQDDGDVSWRIPLGRVNWAMPAGVPLHHWATTALSGHPAGEVGALHCGRVLAAAATRLLAEPKRVASAREELERRVGNNRPAPPEYSPNRCFFENPAAFWDGTWTEQEDSTP